MSSVVSASLGADASAPVTSAKAVEAAGWTSSGVVAGLDGAGSADGSCDEDAA